MTKQAESVPMVPRPESDAGAPGTIHPSGDRNVLLRAVPPLHSSGVALPGARALPLGPFQEPVVRVSGVPRDLPAPALREGLSDLRLATGVNVPLRDYAEGVALVLSALARRSIV